MLEYLRQYPDIKPNRLNKILSDISGSHGHEYIDDNLLEYCAV
jgi:hypothetical protein